MKRRKNARLYALKMSRFRDFQHIAEAHRSRAEDQFNLSTQTGSEVELLRATFKVTYKQADINDSRDYR